MKHYLWELRPYFRQVAGALVLGSIAGVLMNTLVVLPAVYLEVRAYFERDAVPSSAAGPELSAER